MEKEIKIIVSIDPERYTKYLSKPIDDDTLWDLIVEDIMLDVKEGNAEIPFDEIRDMVDKMLPEGENYDGYDGE